LYFFSVPGFKFLDTFGRRQILRHGSADFPDSLANFCADFIRWITVLNNQVTDIARKKYDFYRPLGAAADSDHFGDINEMVLNPLPAAKTGQARLADKL